MGTIKLIDTASGEVEWTGTVEAFLLGNEDLPEEEVNAIKRLARGESLKLGGGAAPEFTIEHVLPRARFIVTFGMAEICLEFMSEQDPADVAAPCKVLDALHAFEHAGNDAEKSDAVSCARQAIESWMVLDRAACVGLLGPGLGVEQ